MKMPRNSVQEREIENLLEQYLKEKGYIYDFGNPDRNVYMQSPRTEDEFIKLEGTRPDYMIYLDKEDIKPAIIYRGKKAEYESQSNVHTIDEVCHKIGILNCSNI